MKYECVRFANHYSIFINVLLKSPNFFGIGSSFFSPMASMPSSQWKYTNGTLTAVTFSHSQHPGALQSKNGPFPLPAVHSQQQVPNVSGH